ncbi:hypothetical protein PR202_gb16767 [Eleusine coracana subsp. coracana]|uniref:DUF1618 domain-containing protein n=1 Tax=Eleusine coracana subsp. coracana TaxID=191504 RepID=A0AAV5F1M2_ELECO|nr:hypothetical protein PR202_gb16710 [Eleusine coracana subsp. coracana]GJN28619.1 hypothetical protein PR202_gb16767 [Eleusine coracana subsp. coracana]
METHEKQSPSDSPPSYPPWVMLENPCEHKIEGSTVDLNTLVASHTSTGLPIRVALPFAAPPSALQREHVLTDEATGFLHRGKEEFVVAELKMVKVGAGSKDDYSLLNIGMAKTSPKEAELLIFHSGGNIWRVTRPLISNCDGVDEQHLLSSWTTFRVFPVVGDKQLCWVDLYRGLIFSDVFDEIPELRYVPLPVVVEEEDPHSHSSERDSYVVTCGAAGSTVKFVHIFPRCCCGDAGISRCWRPHHAYTIKTWTLRMTDDVLWEMDGIVDATEQFHMHRTLVMI